MTDTAYTLIENDSQIESATREIARHSYLGVDTETTGLDPYTSRVRLLQISTPDHVFIFDLFKVDALTNAALCEILSSTSATKVLHHSKFDMKMLLHHFNLEVRGVFDTLLASQLISAGRSEGSHGLAGVVERYLGVSVDKTQQSSDWSKSLSDIQYEYAAKDAALLLPLRERLEQKIIEFGLEEVARIEFECALPLAAMEIAGMPLDADCWRKLVAGVERAHEILSTDLKRDLAAGVQQMTLFGEATINLDSPAQIIDALTRMGIKVEGTRSLELQPLADKYPVVRKLLEYRSVQKALSSYGMTILDHVHPTTGRIHSDFHQIGAMGGRMSCSNPNLQQIPNTPEYRSCFRAPAGRKIVTADYSQIELRILADWSQDTALVKALMSGEDLHSVTASQMFDVPIGEVTKDQRAAAKQLNYGLMYGLGAQGLAARIDCTTEEAEGLIRKYFAAYSGVAAWLRDAADRAVHDRQTRTRAGRLVCFTFDAEDRSQVAATHRVGKNTPIQGCLGPDVRIHTDCGIWRISDLAVRDCSDMRVFDGKNYVPFRAFPSGEKPAYEITTKDGWSIIASANHRFLVTTSDGPIWKQTDKLVSGDLLTAVREPAPGGVDELAPYSYVKGHWRETYKSYPLPTRWTPMLAELIGSLIGDGYYGPSAVSGTMTLVLGEQDYDLRDWYVRAWEELFGYHAIVRERPAEGQRLSRSTISTHSVEIRGFLEAQGLARVIGIDKFIPESIFHTSPEIRASVLRGLFTTDGTVTKDIIPVFCNTSSSVAIGVRHLLNSLGIASSLRSYPYSDKIVYRVSVSRTDVKHFAEIVGFRSTRKQARLSIPKMALSRDKAPVWMLKEVGRAGLTTSVFTPGERAHLRRFVQGSGSVQSLVKYRDRIKTDWQAPGLDQVEAYRYVPVTSVKCLGFEIEMYDIEVFADTHSFVADGIITHNSSADMLKRALALLYDALKQFDARIVNCVHDEIVVEVAEAEAEECARAVEREMVAAAREFIRSVPVSVDATIGDAWLK